MKVAGIIAEYNPFHMGHKYHIEETKKQTGADYIVVCMSGDFVQRGEPAFMDKYIRTRMALEAGADAVIELPVQYALASAESFALGGVSLLDSLGCIDYLSFGCETPDEKALSLAADILLAEPEDYKKKLTEELKKGSSFPKAREKALADYIARSIDQESLDKIEKLLSNPNNILAIEYLKSLKTKKSKIQACLIQRKGMDYLESSLEPEDAKYPSAMYLRKTIQADISKEEFMKLGLTTDKEKLWAELNKSYPVEADDFTLALKYRLMQAKNKEENLTKYLDVSEEIQNRIYNLANELTKVDAFAAAIKTKQYTLTRIKRCLMHILLEIEADQTEAKYVRLLGFRKEASQLIKAMQEEGRYPVFQRPAKAKEILEEEQLMLFKQDVFASELYESTKALKFKQAQEEAFSEYRQSPVIL